MPQGLQVWDASGNLIIDLGSSLGRVLGVATISGSATSSIPDARLNQGTPFWVVLPANGSSSPGVVDYDVPNIGATPTAIEYSPGYATAGKNYTIIYGVC